MKKGIRRCIQCRLLKDRHLMYRLNRETTGIDALPAGRSMYLCQQVKCLQQALSNRRLVKLVPGLTASDWTQICRWLLDLSSTQAERRVNFEVFD